MSREQIEKRIRSLFFFLFGVIFTFIFILTSSYLDLSKKSDSRQKRQVTNFLIEGLNVREKVIFQEFSTRNLNSISFRISDFLNDLNIKDYDLVIMESNDCLHGRLKQCELVKSLKSSKNEKRTFALESLGKIFIRMPVIAWGQELGFVALIIPTDQIVREHGFFDHLLYYVLPFIILVILTLTIYFFTERSLIKPTIDKIIEAEKLELQRRIFRQFAHDIQSPIIALETVLENSNEFPEESKELVSEALVRITDISNDLLDSGKRPVTSKTVKEIVEEVIRDKKNEYSEKDYILNLSLTNELERYLITGHDLYRVLSNLINNSFEAIKGASKLNLSLEVKHGPGHLEFKLIDNGIGIAQDALDAVLCGKYSTKPSGNGLGLSGAKRWVESLNGCFELNSILNKGTIISFILPVDNQVISKSC